MSTFTSRLSLCLLLALGLTQAMAQDTNQPPPLTNVLVRFKADNLPYPGITNYPAQIEKVEFQTNIAGWATNMLDTDYAAYVAAIQSLPAWQTGKSLMASNQLRQTKYDARVFASNVVNGVDGISLYFRATAEANWFFLNHVRTNLGMAALSRGVYKTTIDTNIANFGQ